MCHMEWLIFIWENELENIITNRFKRWIYFII
jgi:hypothetical protein